MNKTTIIRIIMLIAFGATFVVFLIHILKHYPYNKLEGVENNRKY